MKRKLLCPFLLICFGGICLLGYIMTEQEAKEDMVYKRFVEQEFPAPSFLDSLGGQENIPELKEAVQQGTKEIEEKNTGFPVIGRITIPGTPIDYPITQGFDTQAYLTTDITGKENRIGTLFVLADNDVVHDRNVVIYGHNMGSHKKAMFSTLLSYKEKEYWQKHRFIRLTVNGETRLYQIFAAFAYDTRELEKWNFSQYNFAGEESFRNFTNRAKALSTYGDLNIKGQRIVTLVTCDRSLDKLYGRYIVMGIGG